MDKHRKLAKEMVRGCGECNKSDKCNGICFNRPLFEAVAVTSMRKDEEFSKLVDDTLRFMDCDAYNDDARTAFRLFAKELVRKLNDE